MSFHLQSASIPLFSADSYLFVPSRRVVPILNFKDVKTNRFAVGTIPFVIDWGTDKQGTDMDRYIVHGNSRATVWFFGSVTTVWLCPREGTRVNIGLKLLTQRDHDTARHLQYDLSVPAGGEYSHVSD